MSDNVVSAFVTNENHEYITIFTDKNTAKRMKCDDIEVSTRAKKGILINNMVIIIIFLIITSFQNTPKKSLIKLTTT